MTTPVLLLLPDETTVERLCGALNSIDIKVRSLGGALIGRPTEDWAAQSAAHRATHDIIDRLKTHWQEDA